MSVMSLSMTNVNVFTVPFNNTIMINILMIFKGPILLKMSRNVVKDTAKIIPEFPRNIHC